jgi:hypothetical protein
MRTVKNDARADQKLYFLCLSKLLFLWGNAIWKLMVSMLNVEIRENGDRINCSYNESSMPRGHVLKW